MTATEIKNSEIIQQTTTGGITIGRDWSSVTSVSSISIYPFEMPDFYWEYNNEKRKRQEAENEVGFLRKELRKQKPIPAVKRILKNGDYMTVLWEDGEKTIVKRAEDEPESDYAAFTAALGIKVFGTNSALKKVVASAEWQHKKKQKKEEK